MKKNDCLQKNIKPCPKCSKKMRVDSPHETCYRCREVKKKWQEKNRKELKSKRKYGSDNFVIGKFKMF